MTFLSKIVLLERPAPHLLRSECSHAVGRCMVVELTSGLMVGLSVLVPGGV